MLNYRKRERSNQAIFRSFFSSLLTAVIYFALAESVGGTIANNTVATGALPGTIKDIDLGSSISYFEPLKGVSKFTQHENDVGALILIWQDDKAYYVTPRHIRLQILNPQSRFTIHSIAISKDKIATSKITIVWSPREPVIEPLKNNFGDWLFCVSFLSAMLFVLIALTFQEWNRRRWDRATLFDESGMAVMMGPAVIVEIVAKLLSLGHSVNFIKYQKGKITSSETVPPLLKLRTLVIASHRKSYHRKWIARYWRGFKRGSFGLLCKALKLEPTACVL